MQIKAKKIGIYIAIILLVSSMLLLFVGCKSTKINVIARDAASGTRTTFDSFIGVDGVRKDASYLNSNGMILSCVNRDRRAIGYVANKSFQDSRSSFPNIKVVSIDGQNPETKDYALGHDLTLIYRAENLQKNGTLNNFLEFLKSTEVNSILIKQGYVAIESTPIEFTVPEEVLTSSLIIGGSTTVEPLMQILVERYKKILGTKLTAKIEIQGGGSSKGITDVKSGQFHLGMISRDLKENEKEGLTPRVLAKENIVVIVNTKNSVSNLTREQLQWIYEGKIKDWTQINSEE